MGLDVIGMRGLTPSDEDDGVYIQPCEPFTDRADGLTPGWYTAEKIYHFRAGSYTSYYYWRSDLCRAAIGVSPTDIWSGDVTDGPFIELINFSDCEGVIGPETSSKLAKDFRDCRNLMPNDPDFMRVYDNFHKAFEMAAQNGAVLLA